MRATTDADAVTAFLPFQGDRLVDPHFRFETGGGHDQPRDRDAGSRAYARQPLWQRLERPGKRSRPDLRRRSDLDEPGDRGDGGPAAGNAGWPPARSTRPAERPWSPPISTTCRRWRGPEPAERRCPAPGQGRAGDLERGTGRRRVQRLHSVRDDRTTNKCRPEPTKNTSIEPGQPGERQSDDRSWSRS